MPSPPSYQKVNPADQPVLFLTLSSKTMPLSLVDQYAETVLAQRLSMVSGVAGVNVFGAQKFAVRIDVDPTQLASRQIGIDQVASGVAGANVNRPTGTLYGPQRNFVVQTSGQLMDAEAYRPIPVAYRNGSPVRLERGRQRLRRRREPAQRQLVQRHAGHLPRDRAAAGHQHRGGRGRHQGAPAAAAGAAAGRRSNWPSAATARCRSGSRSRTSSSRCILTVFLVVLVIFLFLRNVSATIIPSLALPFSIVGTFAVMYAARLQPRQPVADGADALGRLRRRRRDRHAGEHRPPHGDGEAAAPGGVRRLEGDRLHDRLDDAVAGGGLHPDPVHGRDRRAADARVRGHHRGGDPRLRLRLADAHADAVQPVPQAAARR